MKNKQKGADVFWTISDMGSIKIFNSGISFFYKNGFGDGSNKVYIFEQRINLASINNNFIGHFTIKDKGCYLSKHDCSNEGIYEFKQGMWGVYLLKEMQFLIEYWGEGVED